MSEFAPVSVGIPTYARGERVFEPIARLLACTPPPAEIIVHLDADHDGLGNKIIERFPMVRLLSSATRLGPGGGRHRCLLAASQPYFASFDDDSWPMDADYFSRLVAHFEHAPKVAVLAAMVTRRLEKELPLASLNWEVVDYSGCAHAMRVAAYRSIPGYVDRPDAYGLEERDVAHQLHAAGWSFLQCGDLRVFHDTELPHPPRRPEITEAMIENTALLVWLRYPLLLWPYGFLQYANVIFFMLKEHRWRGIIAGILRTPVELWRHRHLRRPLSVTAVITYLRKRTPMVPREAWNKMGGPQSSKP